MLPYVAAHNAFMLIYSYLPLPFRAFILTSLFFSFVWSLVRRILDL